MVEIPLHGKPVQGLLRAATNAAVMHVRGDYDTYSLSVTSVTKNVRFDRKDVLSTTYSSAYHQTRYQAWLFRLHFRHAAAATSKII